MSGRDVLGASPNPWGKASAFRQRTDQFQLNMRTEIGLLSEKAQKCSFVYAEAARLGGSE